MEKLFSIGRLAYKRQWKFGGYKRFSVFLSLIFLGIVLGVLFSNLFHGTYSAAWENWHNQFKTGLTSVPINGQELLIYIIMEKIKAFALLWILSTTVFGIPYIYFYCVYQGFTMSFLFCCVMQTYGIRAFLVFGAYYFPQCLLYVPVFLMTFSKCRELNRHWGKDDASNLAGKVKSTKGYVFTFLLLLAFLLAGCLLEAYGNPSVLKGVL